MKPSLDIKLGQQLTMTPQLQQAIRLLQLSTLDLQHEIQQVLDSNPLLEVDEPSVSDDALTEAELLAKGLTDFNDLPTETAVDEITEELQQPWNDNDSAYDLASDQVWDGAYQPPSFASPQDYGDDLATRTGITETLQAHLEWQLNLTHLSDVDRIIGLSLIEAIDDNGYLTVAVEEIHNELKSELEIELADVDMVLRMIQQFEPAGVGCRNLRECLLLQIQQLPHKTDDVVHAYQIVDRFIAQLGNHDYNTIMRRSQLKERQLRSAMALIQSLTPYPGATIKQSNTEYVIPDVLVSKHNGRWIVELNPETAPKLRVNHGYAAMIRRADNSADNNYLKNNLQEARWFIKSLQSRNETLLKVANKIVELQRGFFDYGEEAMKPLVLHDIADAIDMHESTVSRVTTQKYMHTPRGIFSLKYFFSSHVATASGGECSSTAIRALIKKLVANESPSKPLSDNKIAHLLEDQGINVARRTIAKYRESLHIPPSNERKRLL